MKHEIFHCVYVIMGVSGCGKTSIGTALADQLNIDFLEGDEFHSMENKKKMSRGIPLSEHDRRGWLEQLHSQLINTKGSVVLACSALKSTYRKMLCVNQKKTAFIHLLASNEALKKRLLSRTGHFFNPLLLDDQLKTLECLQKNEIGFSVNAEQKVETAVLEIIENLKHAHLLK